MARHALVIAEHDHGAVKAATLNTVTAARATAAATCTCWSPATTPAARRQAAAARSPAWPRCCTPTAAASPSSWPRTSRRRCSRSPSSYSHFLFPATAHGKNVAPRVAAKLDVAQISDITKVDRADTFERPIYAGNAIATVQSADAIKVITVRTTGFDAGGGERRQRGGRERSTPVADSGKSQLRRHARSPRATGPS